MNIKLSIKSRYMFSFILLTHLQSPALWRNVRTKMATGLSINRLPIRPLMQPQSRSLSTIAWIGLAVGGASCVAKYLNSPLHARVTSGADGAKKNWRSAANNWDIIKLTIGGFKKGWARAVKKENDEKLRKKLYLLLNNVYSSRDFDGARFQEFSRTIAGIPFPELINLPVTEKEGSYYLWGGQSTYYSREMAGVNYDWRRMKESSTLLHPLAHWVPEEYLDAVIDKGIAYYKGKNMPREQAKKECYNAISRSIIYTDSREYMTYNNISLGTETRREFFYEVAKTEKKKLLEMRTA